MVPWLQAVSALRALTLGGRWVWRGSEGNEGLAVDLVQPPYLMVLMTLMVSPKKNNVLKHTTGNSGFLFCWPREVQSSIRVVRESGGLLSSYRRAKEPTQFLSLGL